MKVRIFVASMLVVAVSAMSASVQAELIVYDGFGYPDGGHLQISDGGDNAANPGQDTGTYDHLDDGTGGPTVLGDPGRNGGTGPWLTSWNKRGRNDSGTDLIDGTSTLTYTDNNGKSLATTLGRPVYDGSGRNIHSWRTFDASGIAGGSLTFPQPEGDYNVPVVGKQDSVVWMSFLADRDVVEGGDASGSWFITMQLWNKRGKTAGGDPFKNRTGAITRDSGTDDWFFFDIASADPTGPSNFTNNGDITGSAAADADESNGHVFIVTKYDYSATVDDVFNGLITDGYAEVSIWTNPDLDDIEPSSAPDFTGNAYVPFNGVNFFQGGPSSGDIDSSFDEFRLGTTYGDVSPIASAGQDGDYDGDGDVDGADFLAWQRGEATGGATPANLTLWQDNYGTPAVSAASAVPEPTSVLLLGIAGVLGVMRRRR